MCAQSCLTLCNPMGYSPPGSPIHEIFQARILEWVAISSSRGFSRSRDWISLSPALADGFFTTKPPRKPTFREKAMPKGIGVSGFVEKVIPFPELSIPSFLAVNSQLYSIILFTGLCIPIDNNGGQKNSLTSTLPPSQIYFSRVKLDRGKKRKEKKKTFKTQLILPRRKGSGLCFLLPRPWQGWFQQAPGSLLHGQGVLCLPSGFQTQPLTVCLTPSIPRLLETSDVSSTRVWKSEDHGGLCHSGQLWFRPIPEIEI